MLEKIRKNIIKICWIIFLCPPILLILAVLVVWLFADIPSFKELENPDNKLATELLSDDGRVIDSYHIENRSYVSYNELSPYLVQAAVATEDSRFYNHAGIDFNALLRVAVKTILLNRSREGGGSTITQQLAKTLYPREDVSSSIPGFSKLKLVGIKLKEWITAVKLERDYSKDEIIDMYLNAVFFGSGAYGIRTAANTFFAKEPKNLNIQEAATLIGMINKPTRYNPAYNPTASLNRRNFVLKQMAKAGYITDKQRDSLQALPIKLDFRLQTHNYSLAPYFRDMLRRYMNEKKPVASNYKYKEEYVADSLLWEKDPLYGWLNKNLKADGTTYNLDKDGLKIYTCLNYNMQVYANEAVAEHLSNSLQKDFNKEMRYKANPPFANDVSKETINRLVKQAMRWSDRYRNLKEDGYNAEQIEADFNKPSRMTVFAWNKAGYIDTVMTARDSILYYKSILRAAFVAIQPNTGYVKAYVGGPNYRFFKYDNVMQGKRQVGSTIKPFLYTLAMQEGLNPDTKVVDVPQTIIIGNQTWTPRSTDNNKWIGKVVDLKWGLTNSSNNISAYLMKQFGPNPMVQIMHKMGISSHIDNVPSICVGSPEVKIFDMVAAYNVFPSHGVYIRPLFVTKIEDSNGKILSNFVASRREALSEKIAFTMVNLMRSVIDHGTGVRLRYKYGFKAPIAGKTGTTNDNSDGWFIAYTPKITAGAWVGAEDRQVHFQSSRLGQGANMALPIWAIFYSKLLKDKTLSITDKDDFKAPLSSIIEQRDSLNNPQVKAHKEVNYFD